MHTPQTAADFIPARGRTPEPRGDRAFGWLVFAVVSAGLVWLLGPVLTPFVVGVLTAYFLEPLVGRLERRGLPRAAASALVVFVMVAVTLAALVVLVPIVALELAELIRAVPERYAAAKSAVARIFPALGPREADGAIDGMLGRLGESMAEADVAILGGLMSGFGGLVQAAVFWVVMPVVVFYLLLDWSRLVATVDGLIPRARLETVRRIAREMDSVLAGYARGMALVCVCLIVYYAALLSAIGLSYGFLVGIVVGAIAFIPYVGAFVGGVLAIGIALGQFWDAPGFVILVVLIFGVGQFLESQVLVPRLVGASVDLHPVWLIFAITGMGYLFGFVGVVAAVPFAASLGVVARAACAAYTRSALYAEGAPLPTAVTG